MALSKGFELAKLGSGLDVNQSTGEVVAISMDTDVVSEGTTNIYFTDARVDNRVASLLAGGTTGNIVTTGYIAGPATFTIDPAGVGDNTGTVVIAGNLQVDGTQTTINSTTLDVDDLNITVASGAANGAAANGAGLTVDGAGANITYTHATTSWDFNKDINVTGTTTTDQYLYVNSPNGTQLQLRSEDAYTTLGVGNRNLNITANRTIFLDDAFAEVMRINDDGNVGIGTTTPTRMLEVYNTSSSMLAQFKSGSGDDAFICFANNTSTADGVRVGSKGNDLVLSTLFTPRVTVKYAGNVGIGTDAPASALHVRGTASTVGATRSVVTLTDDTAMGINVGSGVAFRGLYTSAGLEANYGGIFAGKSNANSGNANGYLSLSYSASGTLTEGIRISETGKVGIGDSTPTANGLTVFSSVTGASRLNLHIGGSGTVPNSGSYNTISNNQHADILISSNAYINGNGNPVIISNHANMGGTGIKISGANGSHDIKFYTSNAANFVRGTELTNTERMTISKYGNVGIGTSTFGVNGKLQVAGGIGLTGNSEIRQSTNSDGNTLRFLGTQFVAGAANSHSYSYTGGALIAARASAHNALLFDVGTSGTSGHKLKVLNDSSGVGGSLQYLHGSDTRFIVKSSTGNVGIGTATPSTKLDISTSGADGITLNADTVTSTASNRLFFNNGTAGKAVGLYNSFNALRFTVLATPGTSTGTEKMRLTEAGFLSLGGHAPATVLDIANVGGAHGLALNADANNATLSSRLFLNNGTAGKAISIMNNGNNLSISTAATPGSGSGSEKVRILENGNVGIGTTNPIMVGGGTGLVINGGANQARFALRNDATGDGSGAGFHLAVTSGSGSNGGQAIFEQRQNNIIAFNLYGSEAMRILPSGNVGIGTTSPSQKLDVAGNIALSGTVDGVDIAARDGVLTSTTTTANAALPKAGGTITGDVSFTNGNKAVFGGTGNGELEIYAHATNNNVYISENAAGNLNLGADNFNIYTNAFTKQVASFTAGSAKLLNDGNEKLATTATGIDVTGNITVSGYIAGPAVLTIDPAGVGDNTGKVVIAGDLQIDGTTTTINSTTLTVDDLNITLASGAADSAAANGAGITVDGANATITYDGTNDEWDFNKDVNVTGNIALSGTVDGVDIAARDGVLTSTTTTANAALPKAGGAITGAITTNSTFDGRNVSVDGDKLDLIEAGATADQTAAQLLTAIKTVDGTGSGLDADLLDGQQGSYYYSSGNPPPLTADPTLTLTGDATGSATFTNLGNATLTVAIADDSHNHTLANIDQVTINNTNDLDTYNTRGLYNWSSSNPANSPYAYGSMLVLPDGSQSQQLLQTYGGTANTVSLYGRRKTSGTWDTTWTQYFSDHYHPNADTLTTARNINGVAFDGSIDITVADATKLPLAGGTLTGGLTINENGDSLHLRNTTNGGSVGVSFSSNVPASQIGHLRFSHSDTVTYGSGAAFVLGSTEATTTILADGKLMFDEGIYSKPATGTGAGTRKDANWDTAYTTANTANTTANAALPKAGGTMTGPLTIDTDNNANGGLRLLVNQTNPEQDFYFAQEIVSTLSGATVTTADREQGGIWIDLNSTATGGGTNHEHRVYGAYLDVDSTGDADMVYGVFADATVTPSTGQTSQVTGGYFKAEDNGGAGAVSSVFGVQGLAQSDNATSDTNTLIGGYFKTTNIADTGNVTTASAVYGEIEIAAGTGDHYGTSHVFQAQYDNNDTVAQTNTTYLYYGNYAGVLPTTAYGVYIADAVTSYFGGTIRSAGDVVAYYSDERLKDFHGTIPNAMDKVKQLNGYYFTENQLAKDLGYNNDSTQVGVSAQEVEAVLPEIVKEAAINTEKGTDYKTVQYEKLTALLIEAVKEQQTEIDELKKLVKDLMSR